MVDNKGEMILKKTYPKIREIYQLDQNIDAMNSKEIDNYMNNYEQAARLHKNKKKILSVLAEHTYLKNNVKSL